MALKHLHNFSIFGSGFGLYGYLPALLNEGIENIHLTKRNYEVFLKRPELAKYKSRVHCHDSEDQTLAQSQGAVLALPPLAQENLLDRILSEKTHPVLLLEKPLGATPHSSKKILQRLRDENITFRIGYIFRYQSWVKLLEEYLQKGGADTKDRLQINWLFHAHHKKYNIDSWKEKPSLGGGLIRFYAVHFIALMAEYNLQHISSEVISTDTDSNPDQCQFRFGRDGKSVDINIDSHGAENIFSVRLLNLAETTSQELLSRQDPFDETAGQDGSDMRISSLQAHISSLSKNNKDFYQWYDKTNDLWREIEEKIAAKG